LLPAIGAIEGVEKMWDFVASRGVEPPSLLECEGIERQALRFRDQRKRDLRGAPRPFD